MHDVLAEFASQRVFTRFEELTRISRGSGNEKVVSDYLKRSQKRAEKEPKKGAERKQAIIEILKKNPAITQTQLMEEMNLTRKQVQKDMRELQKEGVLVREGTNRSGRWMVTNTLK